MKISVRHVTDKMLGRLENKYTDMIYAELADDRYIYVSCFDWVIICDKDINEIDSIASDDRLKVHGCEKHSFSMPYLPMRIVAVERGSSLKPLLYGFNPETQKIEFVSYGDPHILRFTQIQFKIRKTAVVLYYLRCFFAYPYIFIYLA